MAQLSEMRDYLEEILGVQTGSPFVDSTYELQLLNKAYEKTAYYYDWPQLSKRGGIAVIANQDRYDLPTDWRKFQNMFVQGQLYDDGNKTDIRISDYKYVVYQDTDEFKLSLTPTTASTEYLLQDNETAGTSVVVALDSVDGIAAQDEVYIDDSTSSEFTIVQSVDSDNATITVNLMNNHNSGVSLYRSYDIIVFDYQKLVTSLANTTDVPATPPATHLTIPHYSAYLYYKRLRKKNLADADYETWQNELIDEWAGLGKDSTGGVTQFGL